MTINGTDAPQEVALKMDYVASRVHDELAGSGSAEVRVQRALKMLRDAFAVQEPSRAWDEHAALARDAARYRRVRNGTLSARIEPRITMGRYIDGRYIADEALTGNDADAAIDVLLCGVQEQLRIGDAAIALLEHVEFVLDCCVPQTSQQREVWPTLIARAKDARTALLAEKEPK